MDNVSDDSNGASRRKSNYPYTREDLKTAVTKIVETGMSIRRAAFESNIPRTTLSTYLRSASYAKASKLLPHEEQALYQAMTDCCKRGFPIRRRFVQTAAEALMQKSGPAQQRLHPFQENEFGRRCFLKFARRWLSVDQEKDRKYLGHIAGDWFLHIEMYLKEANLLDVLKQPRRVFLCDELRFRERVEMPESVRGLLKQMTMLYTFTAAGAHLSPLLVYPFQRDIPADIVQAAPKNCAIVAHEQGLVTPKTFTAYLDKVVDKYVAANGIEKPILLFVDESKIELTLHLHNSCKRLGIVLLGISASQVCKPTFNVFNDICAGWVQEVPRFQTETGRSFTLADCAGLMQTVNQRYIKAEVLVNDFGTSHLCPWKRPTFEPAERPTASSAIAHSNTTDEDWTNEEEGDDDEMDMEIEHFLENVDGWSDDEYYESEAGCDGAPLDDHDFVDGDNDEYVGDEQEAPKVPDWHSVNGDTKDEQTSIETTAPMVPNKGSSTSSAVHMNSTKESTGEGMEKKDETDQHPIAHNETNAGEQSGDEADGPPDDIDISINFIDFKRAIGSELTERFERKLESEKGVELANHAENVLFDIYRQFRCDIVTDSDDDYDIVEIGDD
ncbi:uncharacterized protein LOC118460258 [Anopheles albimanus]|uniref:HTH psq-type domain-containing protein n=1 Tax=Anopheles albimanus TaxID=7167 RepID=A0A8W7K7H0_ANOAL|nr:uncharacterized protein LOC118460258 [Anopheles albimanus]